jgi:hypothetical protein
MVEKDKKETLTIAYLGINKTRPPQANKTRLRRGFGEVKKEILKMTKSNQQPPKPKCIFCGTIQTGTGKFCNTCGKPVEVNCGDCGTAVKNSVFCSSCGKQLNELPTQQPIVKNKEEKWLITAHEPDSPGTDGKYLIPIQVTCNGKGVKSNLCILVGNNALDGKETHKTNKDGFLLIRVEVKTKRAQLYINLAGFTAETEKRVWLYGKKPEVFNDYWGTILARKKFYKKS